MCRKLIILTSFVLVVGFVNNANAADIVWTGLGADNLWSNPANWEGNKVPTAADDVAIEVPGAAAPNGPLIQDGIDAECGVLWNEVAGEPMMTMTGGTLTISGWGIWWGDGPGCNPTFYQSGGTVSLTGGPGIHEFGWGGASGTWIMTGGTVNAKGISIPSGAGNSGEIQLHGGTYNVGMERGGLVMRENGLIDITEGTFILEGDETAKINDLIAAGQITAYGGAGQFEIDYDGRNPGSTTVTAIEAGKAYKPDPADGALYEDTWASLGWSPADAAASHDVYFGDNFDNVNNGTGDTFRGNQVDTFYVVGFPGYPYPDGLVPGTTYYWRIDEVEADGTIHKGDIWSFMVPPKTAYDPDPADGAEFVDLNVELNWTEGFGAILHTVYFGDNFDDVDSAAEGPSQGEATYTPGPLELEKVYYWRVDEYDAVATHKGDVWSFTTPGAVGSPNPANGAIDVQMTATLSWTPADNAASHQVYFGTDKDAVRNADTASPEYIGTRNLGLENYDPGKLAWYSTYYWRVDEVYDADPANPVKGPLWSFTTADFILVDDFESYTDNVDAAETIFHIWLDGMGYIEPTPAYLGNGTGSVVGYISGPPFAEQSIVHGGFQSMPLYYDNDGTALDGTEYEKSGLAFYSEAQREVHQNWTEEGVGVLSLWFYGDASNAAERMYVALNGSAVVYHDDPSAAQIDDWTQWTIGLQEFAAQGVDLTNVNTISIGFGDKNNVQAGGSGLVFFDDIRLYRPLAGPVLKLDLGNSHNAEELEEGFTSFTIADSGSQIDGITVELGGTLDSRRRGAPAGVPFEQIYRDFIFSRPGAMTVTLSGLAANTTYEITIYAWDTLSVETRIADWTANGISVCQTVFDGAQDPPTSEDDYAFTGKATSDSTGTILLESAPGEGTREPSGASHPFTFLNALVLVPTEEEPPPPATISTTIDSFESGVGAWEIMDPAETLAQSTEAVTDGTYSMQRNFTSGWHEVDLDVSGLIDVLNANDTLEVDVTCSITAEEMGWWLEQVIVLQGGYGDGAGDYYLQGPMVNVASPDGTPTTTTVSFNYGPELTNGPLTGWAKIRLVVNTGPGPAGVLYCDNLRAVPAP